MVSKMENGHGKVWICLLILVLAALLILPIFFGLNGIWCAIMAAELLTLIVTGSFLLQEKKKYHY